jgi:rRNA maturation protein Nop10
MKLQIYNTLQWLFQAEPRYKLQCEHCGLIQLEVNWDYQKCNNCGTYLYDMRNI